MDAAGAPAIHTQGGGMRQEAEIFFALLLGVLLATTSSRAAAAQEGPSDCTAQLAPLANTGSSRSGSDLRTWSRQEAQSWRGEGWLGWNANGEKLDSLRLSVTDISAAGTAELPPEYDEAAVDVVPNVDFAIRCVAQLRAGPIHSATLAGDGSLFRGPLDISLAGDRYRIRVESAGEDFSDSKVVLSLGARSQVLYSADGFADEPHYDVLWAGDLDADGKLDLVVDLHRKYSWHPYTLLLSSRASPSQLVGVAAVFETGD
jgi:hypothetical protein